MRSRSYDRTDLREAPVSRSRSLDVLLRKAVVHPFGSLADAKDKLLFNTRVLNGMSYSSRICGGARRFRVSPVDLASAVTGRMTPVYKSKPKLKLRILTFKVVDVSILRAIKQGLLLQSTRIKEVANPVNISGDHCQDRGSDPRFPFWVAGEPGVDVCKEVISRFGFLDVLQVNVDVSTPVPSNTRSFAPTFVHDSAPYKLEKPAAVCPQMRSVACQTPMNVYLDSKGFYRAVQHPSQRQRVISAAQVRRQNRRNLKFIEQKEITKEFLDIAREQIPFDDMTKFYSVPLDFSLCRNKVKISMIELEWIEGEFHQRAIEKPSLINKILYLHNLRPIQAKHSDECDRCAICQERLLWIADLCHVGRGCPHLLHRECLQSLIKRTWSKKHISCPSCRCLSHLRGKGSSHCEWIDSEVPNPVSWYEGNEDIYSGAGGGIDDLDEEEYNFVMDIRPSPSFPSRWW